GAPDPFLAGPTGRGGRRLLRFAARPSTAVGEHPQSSRQCRDEVRPADLREGLAAAPDRTLPPERHVRAADSYSGGLRRQQQRSGMTGQGSSTSGSGAEPREWCRRPVRWTDRLDDRGELLWAQPSLRARRAASSSIASMAASSSGSRSLGSSDRVPSTSFHTRPTAMPNTPCPPCRRSTASSGDVHAKTLALSDMRVIWERSSTPRERR